ncbi:Transposon Tf2-8 polyprotein [Labeo rohita]|uniref:ribonuclease H n=1 Tax=Labeo rohita TaxID=84645 RepID=A0ABQ8L7K1_LABRO|nr:Transposon Tf2-8 polyprotein [Labeo rohita]
MESTQPTSSLQNTLPGADRAELLTLQAANEHLTQYIRSLPAPQPDPVRFALPDKFDGSPDNFCLLSYKQNYYAKTTHFISPNLLPLPSRFALLHIEEITLYVISSPQNAVILGYPWLSTHDPQFSWKEKELIRWSPHCHTHCLELPNKATVCTTHLIKNLFPLPDNVQIEDADLAELFSKERATKLPPHRPWDCVNDLLPNTSPPRSHVYPLTVPETQAMEEYTEEALSYGFIRPSTSPAASGFFFVEKKDGGLCRCIDYRALNAITVRNHHPLPLIPSSLEQLQEGRYFTKLDLRSAYNLIRIREGDEWMILFSNPLLMKFSRIS